jgi:hypothetical protein
MFRTGVSCFSVTLFYSTLFCCGGKAKFCTVYTPLLYSLDPYRRTDRQTDRDTRCAWAGGTFFLVVLLCCVSFWFLREMRELALHYFPVDCFGIEREIVFGVSYILSVQYSCAVVSVFLLWWES